MRLLRACVLLAFLGCARPVDAQTTPPPEGWTFLPRAEFMFTWGRLFSSDTRFEWLGQMGLDFDVTDFGAGRVRFQTLLEGGLGRERRRYDLNQMNYAFDASLSYRLTRELEAEAVVQHVSRHVVDRDNPPAVSWNAWGARLRYTSEVPDFEGYAELLVPTQPAFVDYSWMSRAWTQYRHPVSARLGVFVAAHGELFGVDETQRGKNRVCGGRIEGGLRIRGDAAALELFTGYERRVDAFPTDRFRVGWTTIGFRITTR